MREVSIKDIAKIHYGKALKKDERVESGEVNVFGSNGVVGNHDDFLFQEPTVIIGRKGSVGKTIYTEEKSWTIDTAFYSEIYKEKVDIKYFYYALTAKDMEQYAITTSIPGINRNDIYDLKIPLPTLPEQKAIVAKLDRAQRLIDIDREMLAKYDELIQSVFLEMFGDPVTVSIEDDNTFELDELADFKGGGTPSKKNKDFWGGDIPWVSPKDMKWTFINNSQDKITSIAIEESSTKLIKSGAVISVVRSGILKNTWPLAINTVDVTLNQDMKALICSEKINNYFLLYYLKNYSRKILGTVRGTTADNISTKVFKNIPIKLPELEKQLVFMRTVKAIMKEKKATKYKKSEELFSSLVQGVIG